MKVIGSGTSPFARKVRVSLLETGLPHEFEPGSSWGAVDTVGHLNPLGKLPVLVRDDGSVLFDSRVIVEYLDLLAGAGCLLPLHPEARIQTRKLEALADGISEAVTLSVQETWRAPSARSAVWLARQTLKVDRGIAELARELEVRDWFIDGRLTAADVAAGVALGLTVFWFPDKPWCAAHPALAAYWERLSQRASFAGTVPQLPAGAKFMQL